MRCFPESFQSTQSGIMDFFFDERSKDSYNFNHAIIFPDWVRDPEQVVKAIEIFEKSGEPWGVNPLKKALKNGNTQLPTEYAVWIICLFLRNSEAREQAEHWLIRSSNG